MISLVSGVEVVVAVATAAVAGFAGAVVVVAAAATAVFGVAVVEKKAVDVAVAVAVATTLWGSLCFAGREAFTGFIFCFFVCAKAAEGSLVWSSGTVLSLLLVLLPVSAFSTTMAATAFVLVSAARRLTREFRRLARFSGGNTVSGRPLWSERSIIHRGVFWEAGRSGRGSGVSPSPSLSISQAEDVSSFSCFKRELD